MRQKRLIRLLLYADSAEQAEDLGLILREAGFALRPRFVDGIAGFDLALREPGWDLIVYRGEPDGEDFARCTALVSRSGEDVPLIAVLDAAHAGDADMLASALRRGATDVVLQGDSVHLQHAVRREIDNLDARRERSALRIALKECDQRCRALAGTSRDAIAFVGRGVHLYANGEYLRSFGLSSPEEVQGKPVIDLIAPGEQQAFGDYLRNFSLRAGEPVVVEVSARRREGKEFTVNFELSRAFLDGEPCVQLQIIRDGVHGEARPTAPAETSSRAQPAAEEAAGEPARAATARPDAQSAEARLPVPQPPRLKAVPAPAGRAPQAEGGTQQRDPLTELYTADHLKTALEEAIALAVRERVRSALMYLDIDNFREVKALAGPAKARELLLDTAATIAVSVPPEDLPARVDESSFGVLLKRKDTEYATGLADRISKEIMAKKWEAAGKTINASCYVGVTPITGRQTNPEEVLGSAYTASRDARRGGDRRVQVYQRELEDPAHLEGTRHLTREILDALHNHRMSLVYQPIVRLSGEPQEIYEVFLRMQNHFGGEIPTSAIFPAAAEHRFVTVLDEWVIANALEILGKRLKAGKITNFFIKLSSEAIKDENLLLNLTKHMKAHQVPGQQLIIEISETTALANPAGAQAFLRGLKQLKCRSALEHFGAGINSMKLLDELPVDYLKVDASLIAGVRKDPHAVSTLQRIVELAHSAGRYTIAECLEDAASLVVLFDCGVDFAQGFYIQEPSPAMEFDFSEQFESTA